MRARFINTLSIRHIWNVNRNARAFLFRERLSPRHDPNTLEIIISQLLSAAQKAASTRRVKSISDYVLKTEIAYKIGQNEKKQTFLYSDWSSSISIFIP